ncbi:J domain-containing protein [Janthinobacterium sp.]|uniref:J domain-containing protein n=1 Tax=Janthinobacterium sp. TaxID=1871054 RepID=UPI00293D9DC2|nr:J domain-containing protein [Janthinobacterium sp.]
MAKIHTHYDNLKVARMAPPEVIRAAYKALSQKYHPDKNPGDEKAARIMAILNSAYGTLADPQRRREHDEWIAAEEWEIEWLESTHQEEHRGKPRNEPYQPDAQAPAAAPYARWRDWKWWCGLLCCLGLGWSGALLTLNRAVPAAQVEAAARAHPDGRVDARTVAQAEPKGDADAWAVGKAQLPEAPAAAPAPDIKVLAVSQLLLPAAAAPACDADGQAALAPNGEAWPLRSGYIEGFPVSNKGAELQLTLDNANNNAPVFIKLYDLERRSNVRYLYILAHDKLTVEQLAFGKYEVRYQRVEAGGEACAAPSAR